MKKKLVIIGANDFQNQLILKAKGMGYETHVFAWQCGDVGEKTADFFYPISIVEKEQILEKCREIKPAGVISIASDLASVTVNYVAEQLGLVCNGMHSAMISTNKHMMRNVFEEHHLPSPKSILVTGEHLPQLPEDMRYPLIVKPTDRSGSRGIFKIEKYEQLESAIEKARAESFEKNVLIEEFAEGNEYSVEYISWEGVHHFLTVTRKFTTGAPNFIETAHLQPANNLSEQVIEKIRAVIPRALDALGVRYGASHSEVKIDQNGELRIIEIGARMGGDCIGSDLVRLSTGYDFVKMVIDVACGQAPNFDEREEGGYASIHFVFSKEDLSKLDWVKENYPDCLVRISQMEPIDGHTVTDSSSRYGYYLLASKDKNDIEKIVGEICGAC